MKKVQVMQIALKQLVPSPSPVRTSWSEKAMDELAQSIKEQGVTVPIKIRLLGNPADPGVHKWEIIYGHRRVEASRRAGKRSIIAIFEDMDDQSALMQALLENVQREGISDFDKGRAYMALKKLDLTYKQIAERVGKSEDWVGQCIRLVRDKTFQKLEHAPVSDAATKAKIIRSATRDDPETRETFAAKVADEGLTRSQTQQVADSLKRTQEPLARVHILATPVADASIVADAVKLMTDEKKEIEDSRWAYLNESPCAKNFIRYVKVNDQRLKDLWQDVERGALGVEHMPYVEERLRKHAKFILGLADALAKWRKEAINGS